MQSCNQPNKAVLTALRESGALNLGALEYETGLPRQTLTDQLGDLLRLGDISSRGESYVISDRHSKAVKRGLFVSTIPKL